MPRRFSFRDLFKTPAPSHQQKELDAGASQNRSIVAETQVAVQPLLQELGSHALETAGILNIFIVSAVTGEEICKINIAASENVAALRREVQLVAAVPGAYAFDLLFGEQLLSGATQLVAAGLTNNVTCSLVRRDINASDLSVEGYSERALGCIAVTWSHTGAQLHLRGMRSGYEKTNVSLEYYTEPTWAEDTDDGVFIHYSKVKGEFRNGESLTKHLKAKRQIRLRSDMVIAEQADGSMWVDLKSDTDGRIRNIFSGMRLQVLSSDEEMLHVRTDQQGDGWVRRQDVTGLGKYCLDWAGYEVVTTEEQVDQRAAPPLYRY